MTPLIIRGGLMLGVALGLMVAGPAMGEQAPVKALAAAPADVLPESELEQARGGYLVAGDLAFQFGAVVSTYQDGALALRTQVNWTDQGPVISRMEDAALAGQAGAAFIQNIDKGDLSNILLNTESGRSYRLETDITLTLPGFAASQGDMLHALAGLRLNDDLANASVRALN